jgi:hypothetical protein
MYGLPESPILLVNHNRLYTSQHDPAQIGPANTARFVPHIRQLIREQGYDAALDFSFKMSQENGLSPGESINYHPGLFLNCTLDGADQPLNYYRSENFQTGEVTTTWTGTSGSFSTQFFVSRADNVVVLKIIGPGKGQLGCTLGITGTVSPLVTSQPVSGPSWIGFRNLYSPGNGGYDGVVNAAVRGGSCSVVDGQVIIKNADELIALIRIDRYRPPASIDFQSLVGSVTKLQADYSRLLSRHAKIHGEIFNRVRLDLGGGADRALTTDVLLARAKSDQKLSPALMEKIYDACRYVILCASGDLPPNLQGIWNGSWNPPFQSDYSADANLQLAIDSQCSGNMPELMLGLFNLVEAGVPSWREGATKLAGCRGILYPARMQDRGVYFQQNHDWQWFNQVSIAGWLGHYFYDYYLYTGDMEFLKSRAIPYLKDCALFYEDWYLTGPDGLLHSTPSFSYECAFSDNATIDFAVAHETLTNLVQGCELLGIEADGVVRWKALLAKIPPYMVNSPATTGGPVPNYRGMDGNGTPAVADGTLKEFIEPNMVEYPSHRHLSSLYPLFVSYELSPEQTPDLWEAAKLQYERKIASVRESESHYRMQASLSAVRLGRGDDAWNFFTLMAANEVFYASLVPSHYDNHNTFNVDASGGIPSVFNNLMIFSQPGQLDILPALPTTLRKGEISGILARGQIRIDRLDWDWDIGKVSAELTSAKAQTVAVGLPPRISRASLYHNGKSVAIVNLGGDKAVGLIELPRGKSSLSIRFTA